MAKNENKTKQNDARLPENCYEEQISYLQWWKMP